MPYMPAPDEATCQTVSAAIYRLTRPDGDVGTTLYAFGWQQDANGQWWMEWPLDFPLPIHPERGTETADRLAMFVQAGCNGSEGDE